MIIRLTLKDPDGVGDSLRDAVERSLPEGLSESEREAVREIREQDAAIACRPWVRYSEYVTVEIDTDAGTAVVVPQERG